VRVSLHALIAPRDFPAPGAHRSRACPRSALEVRKSGKPDLRRAPPSPLKGRGCRERGLGATSEARAIQTATKFAKGSPNVVAVPVLHTTSIITSNNHAMWSAGALRIARCSLCVPLLRGLARIALDSLARPVSRHRDYPARRRADFHKTMSRICASRDARSSRVIAASSISRSSTCESGYRGPANDEDARLIACLQDETVPIKSEPAKARPTLSEDQDQAWSRRIGAQVVDALITANIVAISDLGRAAEIVEQAICTRLTKGDRPGQIRTAR
jgi:hypothetical protein